MKLYQLYESTKYISSHIEGDIAYLDTMIIPPEHRYKGLGKDVYRDWEAKLPDHVKYIQVVPVEKSNNFWYKMGFGDLYFEDGDPDVEVPTVLMKGINGHTVVRQEYDPSDED